VIRTQVTLQVNGRDHEVWVRNDRTLLDVLHDDLGMPDVRYGCNEGVCGTCTVLVDGEPVSACTVYAVQAEGHDVVTLRGWSDPQQEPHPLQKCFLERGAAQCGFCTAGMLLTAATMAERNPDASREEIRHELVGNLCRCTGYQAIVDAVEDYLRLPAGSRADGAPSPQQASRADIPKTGQTIAGAAPEPVADPVSGPVLRGGTA
jgi:carbon-monoxide dehydrogenase small subunit